MTMDSYVKPVIGYVVAIFRDCKTAIQGTEAQESRNRRTLSIALRVFGGGMGVFATLYTLRQLALFVVSPAHASAFGVVSWLFAALLCHDVAVIGLNLRGMSSAKDYKEQWLGLKKIVGEARAAWDQIPSELLGTCLAQYFYPLISQRAVK